MLKRWLMGGSIMLAAAGLCLVLLPASPSRAADHKDNPLTVADPASDITDVYTFMRPEGDGGLSTHAVFVMNVTPSANAASTGGSTFSDKVLYTFRIQRVTSLSPMTIDSADLRITCRYVAAGEEAGELAAMNCDVPNLGSHTVDIGERPDAGADTDDVRIFAGPRADSAFFDRTAFDQTAAANQLKFSASGTNTYAGQNVLSLVVEVNVAKAFRLNDAGSATPMLAVSGETTRN